MSESTSTTTTAEFAEGLSVTQTANGDGLTLTLTLKNPSDDILHWGLSRRPGGAWGRPPENCWPQGTTPADAVAVRTPFSGDGRKEVTIHLDSSSRWRGLAFVVHSPKTNRWIKSGGRDFVVPLPPSPAVRRKKRCRPGWDRKRRRGKRSRWTTAIGYRRPSPDAGRRARPADLRCRRAADAALGTGLAIQAGLDGSAGTVSAGRNHARG